jgi:hypothetical protein
MKTIYGDLFKLPNVDAICIPTSGFVDDTGKAPMLRGIAKSAADLWPNAPEILGKLIKENGNVTQTILQAEHYAVVSFPVRPKKGKRNKDGSNIVAHMHRMFKDGDVVPGWVCKCEMELVELSARWLAILSTDNKWTSVVLPKVGCGFNELKWDDVEKVLDKVLDDRFYVVLDNP